MEDISYSQVNKELLAAIPELGDRFDREASWQGKVGEHPSQYEVIQFVLDPFLRELLDSDNDPGLLMRTFNYLERMACSSDIEVVNLLQVGVLEGLLGYRSKLVTAWKYMGERTKSAARRLARNLGSENILPKK